MTQELVPLARKLAVPYYQNALPAHDQFHASRVHDIARRLASEYEGAVERDVLFAAAWFHDIGRPLETAGEITDHVEWGAVTAGELLQEEEVASDRIAEIQDSIRSHGIRASSPEPSTPEAKLLFDADKLDALGAVGIVRMSCILGEQSGKAGDKIAVIDDSTISESITTNLPDISLLRDRARKRLELLCTEPGQRVGNARWEYIEEFLDQFRAEIDAKR
ncbi:HD domain-containing protein [Halobellus rufus]|uniref:HD domain-containing protein n=1 Tax=Halobellus rufus TaxID=1448860 RepID=UPI0009DDD8A4